MKSLIVDWLSFGLAALLHLPVVLPVSIDICSSDLFPACNYPEIGETVGGNLGVRLAVPCIEDAVTLSRGDVLVGNIGRTWDNAGILRTKSQLFCHGFSCSMAIRSALEGCDCSMFQSGVFRRHPCYREGVTATRFRRRV